MKRYYLYVLALAFLALVSILTTTPVSILTTVSMADAGGMIAMVCVLSLIHI